MKKLDFIVIGAAKSGTTSLFEYLKHHPSLTLPVSKEAPFFSRELAYRRGLDRYLEHNFSRADSKKYWGTITPDYLLGGVYGPDWAGPPEPSDPLHDVSTIPNRIYACLPDVRLIAVLRDPSERAFSHYRMEVLEGREQRTNFNGVVSDLLTPEALRESRRRPAENSYVTRGEYGRLLTPYFELFDHDRILITFTADLERDPKEFLQRIYDFLGVERNFVPNNLGERYRPAATAHRIPWLDAYALQHLAARNVVTTALWRSLPNSARRRGDEIFARTALLIKLWNRRPDDTVASTSAMVRLREHFRPDSARLEALIGCRLPWAGTNGV